MGYRILVCCKVALFTLVHFCSWVWSSGVVGQTPTDSSRYEIIPAPTHHSRFSSDTSFELGGRIVVVFPESHAAAFTHAWRVLKCVLRDLDWAKNSRPGEDAPRQILIGTYAPGTLIGKLCAQDGVIPPPGKESYRLRVTSDRIYAVANTPRGILYAIHSLRQIFNQAKTVRFIRSLDIQDTPYYAFRAVCVGEGEYISSVLPDQPVRSPEQRWTELAEVLNRLCSYKLNTLYYSQEWHFVYSDVPENMELLRRLRDMCAERHIDVIPEFQGLGHASGHAHRFPHYAEAVWHQDEPVILKGDVPIPLEHANVVITKRTGITVKDKSGRVVYDEGTDYRVIPGVTAYRFSPNNPRYKIARIPRGLIGDGQTVLVSYDAVGEYKWDPGYCPMEREHLDAVERPRVHHYMGLFQPEYISVSRDETRILCLDSRCLDSGKSPSELYAEDALRVVGYTQEMVPKPKVLIHYDMMQGGYTLARGMDYGHLRSLIPKWMIPVVWVYKEGDDGRREIRAHAQSLVAQGYNIIAGPSRGNSKNIDLWRRQLGILTKTSRKSESIGYLFLGWSGTPYAWKTMAKAAWEPPPG